MAPLRRPVLLRPRFVGGVSRDGLHLQLHGPLRRCELACALGCSQVTEIKRYPGSLTRLDCGADAAGFDIEAHNFSHRRFLYMRLSGPYGGSAALHAAAAMLVPISGSRFTCLHIGMHFNLVSEKRRKIKHNWK